MNTTTTTTTPRTSRGVLLGGDEAIEIYLRALDRVSVALSHLPATTLDSLLHGRTTRRRLTDNDHAALRTYQRTVRRMHRAGHGELIDDQLDGFLSAIHADRTFRLPRAA